MSEMPGNDQKRWLLPSSPQELDLFVNQILQNLSHGVDEERAVIYSRVSVVDPKAPGHSMEYQPDQAESYALSKGWKIVASYSDPDRTGRNSRRIGLQTVIRDVREGKVTIIVVHRLDRLYRNLESLLSFMRFLEEHNVRLVSVTEQIDTDTWWGRLVFYVLGALAEMYVWQTSVRVREIKSEIVRKGLHNGLCSTCVDLNGPDYCPLAGKPDRPESRRGRIPVPHPIDRYAVQLIHSLYCQGFSYMDIANYLNTHLFRLPDGSSVKFRTRGANNLNPGRPVNRDSVRDIVGNAFYAGLVIHRATRPLDMSDNHLSGVQSGALDDKNSLVTRKKRYSSKRTISEMHPGKHEALISLELWQANQLIRQKRGHTPRLFERSIYEYMLTGIAFCWECFRWDGRQSTLRGVTGGKQRAYYRCATIMERYRAGSRRTGKVISEDALTAAGLGAEEKNEIEPLVKSHRSSLRHAEMEEQVDSLVKKLVIPEEWHDTILAHYLSKEGIRDFELQGYNLRQELARQRELYKLGHISSAEYEREYLRIDRQLRQLKPSIQPEARELIPMIKDFAGLWDRIRLTDKRALLQTMFAGLYFDKDGRLQKISAHSPFDSFFSTESEITTWTA